MAECTECTWCERRGSRDTFTPAEGDLLCPPCRDAYLDAAYGEWLAQYYGEAYRNKRGTDLPVTPRAWRYRR